jgi:LSD1 subclass zinc finger protein
VSYRPACFCIAMFKPVASRYTLSHPLASHRNTPGFILASCRSYQHFCRCGRTLDARLEALGGARLAPRADINREDWAAIDAWIEGVLAALAGLALQSMAELGGMEAPAADGRGAEAAPIKRCSIGRCLVMLTAQLPTLFLFVSTQGSWHMHHSSLKAWLLLSANAPAACCLQVEQGAAILWACSCPGGPVHTVWKGRQEHSEGGNRFGGLWAAVHAWRRAGGLALQLPPGATRPGAGVRCALCES